MNISFCKFVAFVAYFGSATSTFAIDSLPLDQLKHGLWQVERTIQKPGEEPTVRKTEYCASPKKEIDRVLSLAAMLCKSEIKQIADNEFDITAKCNIAPGLSGTNHTTIKLVTPEHYTIETSTEGRQFGKKKSRSEHIEAKRQGDCKDG